MPEIYPLRGVLYATETNSDISTRIAPPYDVLDEGPKQKLLSKDPHNIVAIDLPVTPPKTVGPDEAYASAGELYRHWLSGGVLQQDDAPAIYAYEQQYDVAGQPMKRRGLFAGVQAQPFNQPGGVFRHEHTIPGGVNDRYKLMAASEAQFSPVFSVFRDPDASVVGHLQDAFEGREPDVVGTTRHDGVVHRLWRVADAEALGAVQAFFRDQPVYIADGHHRYTTALKFHEDHPELAGARACLMVLVAAEDPGMIVLPYHRVLKGLTGLTPESLTDAIAGSDALTLTPAGEGPAELDALQTRLEGAGHHAMGLYDAGSKQAWVLTCNKLDPLQASHGDQSDAWRMLDVAILQHLVVEQVLQPAFGQSGELSYAYTADLDALREMTSAESGRLGVIMQATPLQSVMDVADAGGVMPPKSTFFYPKLATGLVINPLG